MGDVRRGREDGSNERRDDRGRRKFSDSEGSSIKSAVDDIRTFDEAKG